jgi:PAS domain S-box-containing protein
MPAAKTLSPTATVRRDGSLWLLLAATYAIAAKLGLALAFVNASATAVWPPTGIALAAVLIYGWRRAWPGIFLGAFLANETTAGSVATSLAIAAGNTSEALLGASLVNRFANGRAAFDKGRTFFLFVLLAGLLSTTVSATVGVTSLALAGFASWATYGFVWLTWWLGDAAGAIVVTPAVVLWWLNPRVAWSRVQFVEAFLLLLALVISGWIIFFKVTYPLGFLCVPLCVWAGFRFGQREAATATCLLSVIAVWGTVRGLGSLGNHSPHEALPLLQVFMGVTTMAGITIGAAVEERKQAEAQVRSLNIDLEQLVRNRTAGLMRALDDLTTSEARLEEAQEVAHTGSWESTPADNRVWWSRELHRMYGIEQASYQAFFEVVHPDDRARVHDLAQRAMEDHQPFEYEHRIVRPDGEVRTIHGRGRVVHEDGRVARIIGTAQDVTERKRIEAQLLLAQKREVLGRLISGVAHDFNNLLTAIGGYTDLVLESLDETSPHWPELQEIRKASARATALTRQLLEFGQRQMLEPQVINVNVVIEAVDTMLRRLIGDNIIVSTALAPDLHGIRADAGHIEQILVNLAVNARDAMPKGGQLTLETKNVMLDGQYGGSKPAHPAVGPYVALTVSDTGCGMDDLVKAHLFEPFFTTKRGQGTGLGLATVYNIVKRSGGYVWVYSEPNRGTTFKVYLPAAEVQPSPLASTTQDILTELPIGAETVLLVEDDEAVRHVARATLRLQGYEVLDAQTGEDGRRLAAEYLHGIDLVLTDVIMPGLDGPSLVAELRMTRPFLKALFMSGYAEGAMIQHGLLPTGTSFLEKPFTPAQLLRKMRAVLDTEPSRSA